MHIPVLKKEILEYLSVKPNDKIIDCTFGEGGHSKAILEKEGKVLGIEWDAELYNKAKSLNLERLILINDSYANIKEIAEKNNFNPANGILIDLGMCSWQIDESERGFSFSKDEPLDMRYGKNGITAEIIANDYSEGEIEKILSEYGEERFAKRIAEKIVIQRKISPIKTTFQLTEIIKSAIPYKYQFGKINSATRTFQALRIAVNDELNNLKKALESSIEILDKGGKIAVISFHSLEDRIVKNFFRDLEKRGRIKILTKKPIIASQEEIRNNARSRSAKLRAAQKI